MPSEQDTEANELQIEVIAEAESGADTQNTTEGEGESESSGLNLNDKAPVDKLSPAQENAKQQEEVWLNKIVSGKNSLEEAPKWLQSRLTNRLEATTKVPETEEVVKKILEQERENAEFKSLQAQIPRLTNQQAKELQERYVSLKQAGKVVALKASLDAMGLSNKVREAEERGIAKGRMSIPRSGQQSVRSTEQSFGGVDLSVINDDKKWNEMIRRGQQD